MLEKRERETLSPFAALSENSKGRRKEIVPCDLRTEFQRDRDRIIYSKAFRRLKHKTQVFIAPLGDHYRTRLTHTLEVAQIARSISRALCLNEDLTEAIAMGHDLGHTPFGHAGERALDSLSEKGFRHNIQSLRIIRELEGGSGINLTLEVEDGILNHVGKDYPFTLEGRVCRLADKIAYINHDIEDSIRAGVIAESDLPKDCLDYFSLNQSARLGKMITDVITNSMDKPVVSMSEEGWSYVTKLRSWMFEHVYLDPITKAEEKKARNIVKSLYEYYTEKLTSYCNKEDIQQLVTDYISGMSDQYAIRRYMDIFIPKPLAEQSNDDALFRRIKESF